MASPSPLIPHPQAPPPPPSSSSSSSLSLKSIEIFRSNPRKSSPPHTSALCSAEIFAEEPVRVLPPSPPTPPTPTSPTWSLRPCRRDEVSGSQVAGVVTALLAAPPPPPPMALIPRDPVMSLTLSPPREGGAGGGGRDRREGRWDSEMREMCLMSIMREMIVEEVRNYINRLRSEGGGATPIIVKSDSASNHQD